LEFRRVLFRSYAAGRSSLVNQEPRDEVATEDEEHVDPDEATGEVRNPGVEQHHQQDSDAPDALDICSERHSVATEVGRHRKDDDSACPGRVTETSSTWSAVPFADMDPTLDYRISTNQEEMDVDAIHEYLARSYWAAGIPRDVVARSIEGSLCFGIFLGTAQVGFARVITDRATYGYLADVYVLEEHRGIGLGKRLMATVDR